MMNLGTVGFKKDQNMNDWQYTNQFFEEGKLAFLNQEQIKDCPYNYLSVDQEDEKLVQSEHYRQSEWLAGFHFGFQESLYEKKTA